MRIYLVLKSIFVAALTVLAVFISADIYKDNFTNNFWTLKVIVPKTSMDLLFAPVRFNDIKCGKTGRFQFQNDSVLIQLEIYNGIKIPANAKVTLQDFGGSALVNIISGTITSSSDTEYCNSKTTLKGEIIKEEKQTLSSPADAYY